MAIGAAIKNYRIEHRITQEEFAELVPVERSHLSRIENGQRDLPGECDPIASRLSWKVAIEVVDQRTGGYISNILNFVPNLDLHPSALKELFLKDQHEAELALEALNMAKHLDPEKRRDGAERVWHEVRDVVEKAVILLGVIEDEFGLDRKQLINIHEQQVKRGER